MLPPLTDAEKAKLVTLMLLDSPKPFTFIDNYSKHAASQTEGCKIVKVGKHKRFLGIIEANKILYKRLNIIDASPSYVAFNLLDYPRILELYTEYVNSQR